ncbi:MAG: hypothetical protein ABJB01_12215 [Rudaea sp.]
MSKKIGSFDAALHQTEATISDDGNWIAFTLKEPGSGTSQIYLAELQDWTDDESSSAVRNLVQVDGDLHGAGIAVSSRPFVSTDGKFVVFQSSRGLTSSTQGSAQIFRYERASKSVKQITANTDGSNTQPSISADGTRIAFASDASNLIANDTNGWEDVYVWDSRAPLTAARFVRVSQSSGTPSGGADAPSDDPTISADGNFVAFTSFANDLAPVFSGAFYVKQNVFLYSMADGQSYLVNSPESTGCKDLLHVETAAGSWPICKANNGPQSSWHPVISGDGRYIAFITELPDLISTWDDGFGDWLPSEMRPPSWTPHPQTRVLLRDMNEGKFYVQSARAVTEDLSSRSVPAWYTTSIGYSSCANMTGKSILDLSLSAQGSATAFQVSDEASHCVMQSNSFKSFGTPDPHTSWSVFLKDGKGQRSNSDPFP